MAGVLAGNARRERTVADLRALHVQGELLEVRRQLVGQRRETVVADLLSTLPLLLSGATQKVRRVQWISYMSRTFTDTNWSNDGKSHQRATYDNNRKKFQTQLKNKKTQFENFGDAHEKKRGSTNSTTFICGTVQTVACGHTCWHNLRAHAW